MGRRQSTESDSPRVTRRSWAPGRLRLDIGALQSRPGLARAMEAAAAGVPHVTGVTANPASASLLLTVDRGADPDVVEAEVLARLVALEAAWVEPADVPRPPLSRILRRALPRPGHRAGPVLLTVGTHSLNILRDLAIITSVNVASGNDVRVLQALGFTSRRAQLRAISATSLVCTIGGVWAQHRRVKAWHRTARGMERRLRSDVFSNVVVQDLAFFDQHGTGPLLDALTDQVESIGAMVEGVDTLVESLVSVLIAGTALVKASPAMALMAGSALPVVIVPGWLLGQKARAAFAKTIPPRAELTQALENILAGIVEVKSFTSEGRETRRVDRLGHQVAETSTSATSAAFLQSTVVRNILYVAAGGGIWHGSNLVLSGTMPAAELTRAVYWLPLMMGAFAATVQSSGVYYGAAANAESLARVLDAKAQVRGGPTRLRRADVRGEIAMEDVSFAYRASTPVLKNITIRVPAGQTVGIVGPTGSGKSTLLRLLLRFYAPDSGSIFLDGHDVADLEVRDVRESIALVSQDVYLFDGTVEENVRYGRPPASDDEMRAALEAAGAVEFFDALPDGLSTQVGERGHRLSGGQRQRIALARALLKDAPILALDEATSHLDYQTEATVKTSLRRHASGKTVLLIAHRLSSVRDADNIIVLDRGQVREEGSHEELLERQGLYRSLWDLQA
jgi:ATP-binding cassette subfamily B protein